MTSSETIISRYFAAMRQGPAAEADMMALFASDAVYSEPFIEPDQPAEGAEAIRERLRTGWQQPLPDMELEVLSVTVEGTTAESTWECRSPALPGPVRGTDRYRFRDGLIISLNVTIDERP